MDHVSGRPLLADLAVDLQAEGRILRIVGKFTHRNETGNRA